MIKFVLIIGLIVNYVPKFRHSVLTQLKFRKKTPLLFFETIIPTVAMIQLYLLNPESNPTTYGGIIIFSAGIILGTFARLQLQENYLPLLAASLSSKITTHGLYKFIRHPIYLSAVLAVIGFELILYPLLVLITLIIIPMLVWQINKEEKFLSEHHRVEWEKYAVNTPFKLIPFVY